MAAHAALSTFSTRGWRTWIYGQEWHVRYNKLRITMRTPFKYNGSSGVRAGPPGYYGHYPCNILAYYLHCLWSDLTNGVGLRYLCEDSAFLQFVVLYTSHCRHPHPTFLT